MFFSDVVIEEQILDKRDLNPLGKKDMSTGGLSVMPSNTHRTQSDGERFTFRPKRAPPPPPTVPVESRPISSECT